MGGKRRNTITKIDNTTSLIVYDDDDDDKLKDKTK